MERVKIAIIGLGRIAKTHIDAIQQLEDICELHAVVDAQENVAADYAEKYNVTYFTSVSDLIQANSTDAAVICLPHNLHADITNQLCEAKIHVLVEKVMATTVEEGQMMVESAKRNNVKLMVGQSRRFFEGALLAKKEASELGDISNVIYTLACYFDEDSAPKWWKDSEKTGGLVYSMQGSHSIDFTLWMMDKKKPVAVYATGLSTNNIFEGHDEASIVITFDDGSIATNILSINTFPVIHDCLIVGSKGSLVFKQGTASTDLVGVEGTQLFLNGQPIQDGISNPHNFTLQMKEFISSIKYDTIPIANGEEILTQLKVIEAAQVSAATGHVVHLN